MNTWSAWRLVACARGSIIAIAAISFAAGQGTSWESGAGSEVQTGVTIAQPPTPGNGYIEQAVPSITGPALLPGGHGLPG